ncbi:hypothetical protein L0F63_001634, partial [Massospora cicadina]
MTLVLNAAIILATIVLAFVITEMAIRAEIEIELVVQVVAKEVVVLNAAKMDISHVNALTEITHLADTVI